MRSERFEFPNAKGEKLAALLDWPLGRPRAFALFAHCFTCGKDNRAARTIAQRLAEAGIAVLRFDFTGLGHSEGEFAATHFSSNVDDIVAAAEQLSLAHEAPSILIGHSLGGAAVLAAASRIPQARCVATIAAPADPSHVTGLFASHVDTIRSEGEAEVMLAGRAFRVRREFLDDVKEQKLLAHVSALQKALLILHAPTDDYVGIDNATQIFLAAKHPKSFVSLAGFDHLLSKAADAAYVADVIAAWASRYLAPAPAAVPEDNAVLVRETRAGKFQQEIAVGTHRLIADEPVKVGGLDSGPGPYDLLLAALGACTAMTLRLYADQKKLPLSRVGVRLTHAKVYAEDCAECETKGAMLDRIDRTVTLHGDLDAEQRARLMQIADKCPVHRTLTSKIEIRTVEGSNEAKVES